MKKNLFYLVLVLVLIQVIRPDKNSSEKASVSSAIIAPEKIQTILKRSCNVCHSNNTKYEWYHNIAPFSWVVASHIKDGKEHVNFDEWDTYNNEQKTHIIDDLRNSIKARKMPLVGYVMIHPEAFISENDKKELLDWITTLEVK